MNFRELAIGTWVTIKSLGKVGQVQTLSSNKAKVLVGELLIKVAISDLETCEAPKIKAKAGTAINVPKYSSAEIRALERIDLHGQTQAAAQELLELHLNRAILAGVSEVQIVHGLGTGKLQELTHKLLSSIKAVRRFQLDNFNPGVTRVYL